MEPFAIPRTSASRLRRVPQVAQERYDGLPFLSYPQRKGIHTITPPPADCSYVPHQSYLRRVPPEPREQECFIQTWLFFGLLSEWLGGNTRKDDDEATIVGKQAERKAVLDMVYRDWTYEEDGKRYVTSQSFLPIVDWLLALPDDANENAEESKAIVRHLSYCLRYATLVLVACAKDFNPEIRLSIAVLGEALTYLVSHAGQEIGIVELPWGMWASDYFTSDVEREMRQLGWCPSEIAKCANTFDSVQMSHFVSTLNKRLPERDHSSCGEQMCAEGQIDMKNYDVGHVSRGCTCSPPAFDIRPVIEILRKEKLVPILKISGNDEDISSLRIDVVESSPDAPYVAISHKEIRLL